MSDCRHLKKRHVATILQPLVVWWKVGFTKTQRTWIQTFSNVVSIDFLRWRYTHVGFSSSFRSSDGASYTSSALSTGCEVELVVHRNSVIKLTYILFYLYTLGLSLMFHNRENDKCNYRSSSAIEIKHSLWKKELSHCFENQKVFMKTHRNPFCEFKLDAILFEIGQI